MDLKKDAEQIISYVIGKVLPDQAVAEVLKDRDFGPGRLYVVAAGKAAWQMAKAAAEILGDRISDGVVVTKYDHVKGPIKGIRCYEGGHPVPDENSFLGTQAALEMVADLEEEDTVLFLLSGGGSALFEKPLIPGEELQDITRQLLGCGAEITETNTIRKRLSAVKGGRFARHCAPAGVYSIVLSDILGDPLDMIASGPAYPDSSTCQDALDVVKKYQLNLSHRALELLEQETPKQLSNVETIVTGSVRSLCSAAEECCRTLGYETVFLTDQLTCEAREAGAFLAAIARSYQNTKKSIAFIAGGETIVHLRGTGLGGRNQELVLAAAEGIAGLQNTAIFSIGSDGTDGPTDAAGGIVDGDTRDTLKNQGRDIYQILQNNDTYHGLAQVDGLIIIGPTGTNVNDVSVLLIRR